VPERCTCGAQLPEDARFCHKCGKPQREEIVVEQPAPPPAATVTVAPPPLPEPPAIGFSNGPAVRIGMMLGLLGFVLTAVFGRAGFPFVVIWLVTVGGFAVHLYRRATGHRLSVSGGAHLGWICGVFGFVVATVMLALIAAAITDPAFVSALREQMKQSGVPSATVDQVLNVLHSPSGIASGLLLSFLMFTVPPAFGGALGAKLLNRER
jgi:hypothetical protein